MSARTEMDDGTIVETRVVVHGMNSDVVLRVDQGDSLSIWVKPEKLDSDGEFCITPAAFVAALERLDIPVKHLAA